MDYSVLSDYFIGSAPKAQFIKKKAIEFLNKFCNLNEHPFNTQEIDVISNADFTLKLDTLLWRILKPKTSSDIKGFYQITPFEFIRNLKRNSDLQHLKIMNVIFNYIKATSPRTLLDYGGGSGYFSLVLSAIGMDVTFSEVNLLALAWMKFAKKELGYKLRILDLNKKKLNGRYDFILAKDVIEHFKEPAKKIEELKRHSDNMLILPGSCCDTEDWAPMHFHFNVNVK